MAPITDKEKKRLAEKHTKLLAELVKQPDNATCADCGAPGPRWASWNIGVFLCIRCGGFHRRIGTHITKVKSISLDNWTPEQIEHFRRIGNKRANAFFNPHPDRHPAPRSDREIERYIRDKYERRMFVDQRNGVMDPTQEGADLSPLPREPVKAGSMDEATALTKLREMGFTNVRDNHAALKKFNFDVARAAAFLAGETEEPAKPTISENDPRVKQLINMGFDHAGQNVQALIQCKGNVNQAIELLLSDNAPPRTSTSAKPAKPAAAPAKPAAAPAASSAAADLLDGDFFGSVSAAPAASASKPAAAAAAPVNPLDDMFGSLTIGSAAPAPATAAAAAPAAASNDTFGDFGDFLSATPAPKPAAAPAVKSPAQSISSPVAASTSPVTVTAPPNGGQSMFDNDFIMSLYSKGPAQPAANTNSAPQGQAAGNNTGNNAFMDLDFFMK
ncbi:Gtpase activating protein [Linderina macrospora]|uniref:Gtpase activating protein n=1 Tax=Linderina macrospora TaxID=4868 RepID=A0ACC1JBE4_9FUNG|nr:Gtpase activating protein [Linderina macrospora]